ncbi:hypothetical protein ACSQ6I_23525 [Anabaena sp. WFMT]|uniref:hypothetical protein n=1 Tax=Anabaena sp. WFMT TaxID=3449730 RepID=UPI003F26EDDA
MTNQPSRLDQLETVLIQTATNLNQVTERLDRVAEQQQINTVAINNLTYKVDDFIGTANTVLGRSAILDDIILRLDRNFDEMQRKSEEHQQRFEENQRSTNAALERLEAILIKLMDK